MEIKILNNWVSLRMLKSDIKNIDNLYNNDNDQSEWTLAHDTGARS